MYKKAYSEVQIRELSQKVKQLPNLHLKRLHCAVMQRFAFQALPLLRYFYKQKLKDSTMKKQETFAIRFFAKKTELQNKTILNSKNQIISPILISL